ncbi:DUF6443 domain-containing protein [Flavobacterium sp. MC2016-06]|jgi:RHS repeat-associated protein|uniref:RHS repeat domain-containing protein n=1 Tax=Flavobacterium sp. MC2016-06 TaxID=2676308 RepID=UPI0012BAAA0A|nr:DUF6443 domain-containing protein [Flavobacterium sp. MC2016-06]MBU3857635.1 RHS repeat-associated core domain-containing protein [Flavobacterium sp. MC2016-06]
MKIIKSFKVVLLFFITIVIQAQTPAVIVKGEINNSYIVTGVETLTATQSITLKPNTWIKQGSVFTAKINPDAYIVPVFSNENYIFTRKFQTEMISTDGIVNNKDVIESIEYFNGLGKVMQNIGIKISPSKYDIVTHVEYDNLGRQDKEYLSYPETTGTIASYRTDAKGKTNSYFISNYSTDINSAAPNPFSQELFENSSLNRVVQKGAPGKDWTLGSGHEIKTDYSVNMASDNVRFYNVSAVWNENLGLYDIALGNNAGTSFYPAGQLYKTIVKDENWTPAAGNYYTTEEFKDKQGKLILKKIYGTSVVNGNNQGVSHETYYVYDIYGNLTYVITPKADGDVNSNVLNDLCYQYKYDDRNRLVEKKLPGKGWEYIVYDKLDRPVLTQDANLKVLNKWNFIKYDDFNRPVYTGEYFNNVNTTRLGVQGLVNDNAVLSEIKQTTVLNINGTDINYSNYAFPKTGIDLLTINYYDDYLNMDLDGGISAVSYGKTPVTNAKGFTTCEKIRTLGTTNWVTTVNYYDAKGRIIYVYSKDNYLTALNTIKTQFDFGGSVLETTSTQKKGSDSVITVVDVYSYDHVGRLLDHKQTINNQTQEVIASNTYDNLGKLITKKVGGGITNNRLQNIDYSYNIRGWLKNINDVNTIGSDLFAFSINYNDIAARSTSLYNGNISKTSWRTANVDNGIKDYVYVYDELNRLAYAIGDQNDQQEIPTYDKNGNIITMYRTDMKPKATSTSKKVMQTIDDLIYTYDGGNRLLKVEDNSNNPEGFFNGVNIIAEYTYDANGNMKTDANKQITNVEYNFLNLPTKIITASGTIEYVYNALGVKQRKIVSGITTDYIRGFQYENNRLQFFSQPEGYVYKNNGVFEYIYQYKDHLGNVRLSYNSSLSIIEENNYYPFGLKQLGYNNIVNSTGNATAQKYKYNGKELQDELGINMYDYGARNYDPTLGRWMNIDPLAEKSRRFNPYTYALNNPVYFIDPDGMMAAPPSTHTDEDGNVIAVIDDGDMGVYKHQNNADGNAPTQSMIENRQHKLGTSAGGEKMGESLTPFGFADFETYAATGILKPGAGARIDFNSTWATDEVSKIFAENPTLPRYAYNARTGKDWDVKNHTPNDNWYYGSNLFGSYASARDAGNFAAGAIAQLSLLPTSFSDYGFGTYNASGNSVWGSIKMLVKDLLLVSNPTTRGTGASSMFIKANYGENPLSSAGIEAGKNFGKILQK